MDLSAVLDVSKPRKDESDDQFSDDEATRRMNDVVKRMIATPPTPHKPLGKAKADATRKKRARPSKSLELKK